MSESTLPAPPSYDPNIPVVSSSGGTAAAYEDPKSPESIMKKATEVKVQSAVDSKYDNAVSAYEGYASFHRLPRFNDTNKILARAGWIFIITALVLLLIEKAKPRGKFLRIVSAVAGIAIGYLLFLVVLSR